MFEVIEFQVVPLTQWIFTTLVIIDPNLAPGVHISENFSSSIK